MDADCRVRVYGTRHSSRPDSESLERRVLLAGVPSAAEIAPVLEQQTGAKVSDLVDSSIAPGTGVPRGELAGVVGALLS